MKRTQLFSLILLIFALLAGGCCDCRKRSKLEKPLVGTEWQLVQLMAKDVVTEEDSYRLTFKSDGTIVGKGDCNVLSATFQTTPSRSLEIKNLGSTRRLCKNFEQENAFMDMLESVPTTRWMPTTCYSLAMVRSWQYLGRLRSNRQIETKKC